MRHKRAAPRCTVSGIDRRTVARCQLAAWAVASRARSAQNVFDLGEAGRAGRHQRQAPDRFEQSHQGHGGLHRDRIRLDEVDLHQRQVLAMNWRGRPGSRWRDAALRDLASSRRESRCRRWRSRPCRRARSPGMVSASSPESTAKRSGTWFRMAAICAMFPEASFTPAMLSISARRFSVAGSTLTPVRPCTL